MDKINEQKKLLWSRNSPETSEALKLLKELVEEGKVKPVVDRYYAFDEIVEAHQYVVKGHKKGNVVINIEDNNYYKKDPFKGPGQ